MLGLQVNKIRQSLQLVARNSTAFGLHQPHMERTKLCEMGDEQLNRQYVEQRTQLRELVQQLAKPKRVNGKVMTGPGLAELVSQMVTALNARDIPTAGSILEHFNKELVYRWEPAILNMRDGHCVGRCCICQHMVHQSHLGIDTLRPHHVSE